MPEDDTNTASRREEDDAGFTLVEVAVTMTILGIIVVSMSAAVIAGLRYLTIAKQRAAAVQWANALVERAHAVAEHDWSQLGLVPSDVVPASDSNLTTGTCAGQSVTTYGGEPVMTAGTSATNPLYPHVQSIDVGATSVTLHVYVTGVTPSGLCSATNPTYKRVTVIGSWARPTGGVSNTVRLATYLYNVSGAPVPTALTQGNAVYQDGSLTATAGVSSTDTTIDLPETVGDGSHTGSSTAYSGSAVSPVSMVGTLSSTKHQSTSLADDDATTAAGTGAWPSSVCDSGNWADFTTGLMGSNLLSTTSSCSSIAYSDGFPYTSSTSSLGSLALQSTVPAGGVLPSFPVTEAAWTSALAATSTVDASGANGSQTGLTSTTSVSIPTIKLLGFSVAGFDASGGAVGVTAGTFSATAPAGVGAAAPSTSGTLSFTIYDPLSQVSGCSSRSGTSCIINVDPGANGFSGRTITANVTLSVSALGIEVARISLATTITVPAQTKTQTSSSGTTTYSKVVYPMPRISTAMTVQAPMGIVLASINDTVDLGQLASVSTYSP